MIDLVMKQRGVGSNKRSLPAQEAVILPIAGKARSAGSIDLNPEAAFGS
jgi:hypothetical protein